MASGPDADESEDLARMEPFEDMDSRARWNTLLKVDIQNDFGMGVGMVVVSNKGCKNRR